ncbi:MAG: flagellar motor switch protein FliN [Phycisphaerae bacterium]|nr:flagellar motor switch protein FliN [Phycisphaerae bacterium]
MAEQEIKDGTRTTPSPGSDPSPADAPVTPGAVSAPAVGEGGKPELPDFSAKVLGSAEQPIDLIGDVELNVKVELGRCRMAVEEVLRLGEGSVVELDKLAGDPVDVLVNDRLVARGEVLVLNDTFCVRVNEIIAEETAST